MRLKYDDTHSDPEFSKSVLNPLNAWVFSRTEVAFPRTAEAFRSRFMGGGIIHFQRIPGQNIIIYEARSTYPIFELFIFHPDILFISLFCQKCVSILNCHLHHCPRKFIFILIDYSDAS